MIRKETNLACVQHTDVEKNRMDVFLRMMDKASEQTLVYVDFAQPKIECKKRLGKYAYTSKNFLIHRSWIGGYKGAK